MVKVAWLNGYLISRDANKHQINCLKVKSILALDQCESECILFVCACADSTEVLRINDYNCTVEDAFVQNDYSHLLLNEMIDTNQ